MWVVTKQWSMVFAQHFWYSLEEQVLLNLYSPHLHRRWACMSKRGDGAGVDVYGAGVDVDATGVDDVLEDLRPAAWKNGCTVGKGDAKEKGVKAWHLGLTSNAMGSMT
jgi:hypothetical protein